MKLTVQNRLHRVLLLAGYLVCPLIGWVAAGLLGGVGGFLFAYGIDRFYPRCMTELRWDDLLCAIIRFQELGFLGSRMHIHIGRRTLYVHRGEVRGQATLGLQFNRREWMGIIDDSLERLFHKKWCDTIMPPKRWKLRHYVTMVVAPERDSPSQAILAMLRESFQRVGLEPEQVFVRTDFARVPIRSLFGRQQRGQIV